jgi:DNA invertase Pin-like site-specific DNA recombinase
MIAVYMRVSTHQQDTKMQKHEIDQYLIKHNITKVNWYVDEGISGKTTQRPEYQRMCADVNAGRITSVIVYKLDRLGRDAITSMRLLLDWMTKGVEFFSVTQPILQLGKDNPFRITIISIFSELAQVERQTIVQRVISGQAAAKARGVKFGHAPIYGPEVARQAKQLRAQGHTFKQIAQALNVSRSTAHKFCTQ